MMDVHRQNKPQRYDTICPVSKISHTSNEVPFNFNKAPRSAGCRCIDINRDYVVKNAPIHDGRTVLILSYAQRNIKNNRDKNILLRSVPLIDFETNIV